MFHRMYAQIMDHEQNPLSGLPKMVRFQWMMVLSFVWSCVFTISIGSYIVLGPTVLGHALVLVAIFFTADVFRRARRSGVVNHRDAMRDRRDGTVLYDDIWGG